MNPDPDAYTMGDIRDLLRFRREQTAFDARLRAMVTAAGPSVPVEKGMNINYWSALNQPQAPRLTQERAAGLAVYRRLVKASYDTFNHDLDDQGLLYFAGQVAGVHGRQVEEVLTLTTDAFERLMDEQESAGPVPSPSEAVRAVDPGEQQERKLTDRQKLILTEMLAMGAVGSTRKTTRNEVAQRINKKKVAADFARDFGALKDALYTSSEAGPDGGVWLTGSGKARAEQLKKENGQ